MLYLITSAYGSSAAGYKATAMCVMNIEAAHAKAMLERMAMLVVLYREHQVEVCGCAGGHKGPAGFFVKADEDRLLRLIDEGYPGVTKLRDEFWWAADPTVAQQALFYMPREAIMWPRIGGEDAEWLYRIGLPAATRPQAYAVFNSGQGLKSKAIPTEVLQELISIEEQGQEK